MGKQITRSRRRGFTLVELLIVIGIIAILAVTGLLSYRGSLERGRDARRRSDMKAVEGAFEQYFNENNEYDTNCAVMDGALPQGLPTDPLDPTFSYSYDCNPTAANLDYCVCAELEVAESGNDCNISCTYGALCIAGNTDLNFFCVSSLQ